MVNDVSDQPLESRCLAAETVDSDSSQSSVTPAPSPRTSETSSCSTIPSSVPPTPPPKSPTQSSLPRQGTSNSSQAGSTSSSDETRCPPSYDIMAILNSPKNQPKGIQVIEEYTKEGKLSRQGRIKLVQLTVSDGLVQAHGTHPSSREKEKLAKDIVIALPNLKDGSTTGYAQFYTPSCNGISASGYIQERLLNIQRGISQQKKRATNHQSKPPGKRPRTVFVPGLQELTDDEVGERKAWLRHNLAPPDTVQQYMRETQTARLSWIHGDEQPSLHKILEEYPRFKDPNGHYWIEEDFQKLHEGSQRLTSTWERFSKQVVDRVALDVKDPAIKRTLALMDTEPELSQDTIGAASLYVMPSLFTPGSIVIKKGSQKRWKPTISESMRAFIAVLPVGADLEKFKQERHAECRKHSVTWQPQVVIIGSSVVDVQQVFLFLNDIIYSVPSIIKGIDVCFKTFQVFNIEYPLECKSAWTFLQRGIYGIETPYDSVTPRVRELLSILKPDSV